MADPATFREMTRLHERMVDLATDEVMALLRRINYPIADERRFEDKLADLLRDA